MRRSYQIEAERLEGLFTEGETITIEQTKRIMHKNGKKEIRHVTDHGRIVFYNVDFDDWGRPEAMIKAEFGNQQRVFNWFWGATNWTTNTGKIIKIKITGMDTNK